MVSIEGKQVIFSTIFFAAHNSTVQIDDIPEIDGNALRFSFINNPDGTDGHIGWGRGEQGVREIYIIPNNTPTAVAKPASCWMKPDGALLNTLYSQPPMDDQSLIHFCVLKYPERAASSPTDAAIAAG